MCRARSRNKDKITKLKEYKTQNKIHRSRASKINNNRQLTNNKYINSQIQTILLLNVNRILQNTNNLNNINNPNNLNNLNNLNNIHTHNNNKISKREI